MVFAYRNTSPERHVYNGNNNFERESFRNDTVFHLNLGRALMHLVIQMRCGRMETCSAEDEVTSHA